MNTSMDKKTRLLIAVSVLSIFVLIVTIVGVYLFKQSQIDVDDSEAATEPIVTAWNYGTRNGDIWKDFPNQTLRFTPPANFQGTVRVESQWAWSGQAQNCFVQVNETHKVTIPGIAKEIVSEDLGDGPELANCTDTIEDLEDFGFPPGPFDKPHGNQNDDSTWFPKPGYSVSGNWTSGQGDLVVNVTYTGVDGPPSEWCDQDTGTMKDSPMCNGSHMFRVRVIWNAAEPTATPTPTPTITPSPTPTSEPQKASIGDFVWNDVNRNGIQDTGEQGVSGATVQLFREGETSPLDTATTGSNGAYGFINIDAGNYFLKFLLPTGYTFSGANIGPDNEKDSDADTTTGQTEVTTLDPGEVDNSWDAGMSRLLGKIGDCVWEDFDKDGIQDENESFGVANVTVGLYNAGSTNTPLVTKTTDTEGCYIFDEVEAGNYVVKFNLPTGFAFSPRSAGSDRCSDSDPDVTTGFTQTINLDAGETDLCWDAGMYRLNPMIQIIKSANAEHTSDYQTVDEGSNATFYITVKNIGEVDLENVVITDEVTPSCARNVSDQDLAATDGVLAVGQSVSYTCQYNNVTEQFDNVAEVTGDPVNGGSPVTHWDSSTVIPSETPGIMIRKSEKPEHTTALDTQTVASGSKAKFYITVTNIGSLVLGDVIVTDVLAPGCNMNVSIDLLENNVPTNLLGIGQSASYECESEAVTASFINTAVVTGDPVTADPVSDEDDSAVVVPGDITVNKLSSMQCQGDSAAVVQYSIQLTNPTSEARTLVLTDSLDGKISADQLTTASITGGGVYNQDLNQIVWSNIQLTGGQSVTYSYTVTIASSGFGQYENTAIARQDGVEVGRDVETITVSCLPATGLLDENRWMTVAIGAGIVVLGVAFYAFKGHVYVGKLLTRRSDRDTILVD